MQKIFEDETSLYIEEIIGIYSKLFLSNKKKPQHTLKISKYGKLERMKSSMH